MTVEFTLAAGVFGLAVLTVVLAQAVTAVIAFRVDRVSVVDVTWGLGFVVVATTTALWTSAIDAAGTPWRRWLIATLVAGWGLRLARHISRKHRGHPTEDPRYAELLGGLSPRRGGMGVALRKVFAIQGVAMLVVSLPVLAAMAYPVQLLGATLLGLVVFAVGFLFEVVGDAQLAAYKQLTPRPAVLDTGLWAWTRHPNYFGDACLWWGIWLIGGLGSGWLVGVLTIAGPLAMTYFLAFATGARLLEETMMRRPGYAEYAARTPMFVPRPPLRRP